MRSEKAYGSISARDWNGNLPLMASMLEAEGEKTGRQRVTLREITRSCGKWTENGEVDVTGAQQCSPLLDPS